VADTINFASSLSGQTITLTSGQLPTITDGAGLTIDGGSVNIEINGLNSYRVFEVGSGAKLTLSNLTVAEGAAADRAFGGGGGILNNGTVTVSNSTLSGNSSNGGGGGIFNQSGTLTVSNSTLSGNSTTGGGFGGAYTALGTSATFKNTIVANSPSGGNCGAIPNDGGYNLDSDKGSFDTCGFSTNNNSLSGVDPMLGALADNGGPTQTHALLEGSPAIDKGNSFGESTDQRSLVRPSNFVGIPDASGGDGSDIGAFELQAPDTTPPKVTSTVPGNGGEVGPAVNVKATFSEKMDTNTINGQTFKLFKKGSTTQIAAQVSYSVSTRTAKLDPTNNLRRGVTYKAVVSTGAKDLAGNQLDQNTKTTGLKQKVWYFTVNA